MRSWIAHGQSVASRMIMVEALMRVDPNWWNGLVGSSPHGTIYQTTHWAKYFRLYYRARPYFLAAREGADVLGLLLLFHMGRFPDRDAARPWLDHFKRPINALLRVFRWFNGPVVLDPARNAEVMAALLRKVDELANRDRVFSLEYGGLPIEHHGNDKAIAEAAGFGVVEWGTFVVDLAAPIETLWARMMASAARSSVKRAVKLGLRAYDATHDPVDSYDRCGYEHGRAQGIRPRPRAWFIAIRDALAPANAYRVFAAEYEGRPVAYTPVVLFNRTMHLIRPVQLPACVERKVPAGDFLLWEAIKFGHEQGLEIFDLSGVAPAPSTTAERGIWFFKSKWGGNYMTYPILRKRYRWRRLS